MDFLNASFRIGRAFDIDIRVHILFLIWAGFRLFTAGGDMMYEAWFLGMLFGIILIHEFGHCFGARSVGGDAHQILMWPLGGLAFAHAPMTPWAQFVTVAAGPAVNVVFCVVSAPILMAQGVEISINPLGPQSYPASAPEWVYYMLMFYRVNLFLLAFNLLPVYPLDGGQLFQTLLWPWLGLHRATIVACQVGIGGCILFGIWGLQGGSNMLFFIAIFGGFTCWQRLQMAKMGMLFDERIGQYNATGRYHRKRSLWTRMADKFRREPADDDDSGQDYGPLHNPNPGGWKRKQEEAQKQEAELDRILKKVHDEGVHALSYTERQVLERATREKQSRDPKV